jgi:hypothetical protein
MGIDVGPIEATQTLALNFDVGNIRSYPGSGTSVIGLVGGIGFTLSNGVGFGTSGTNYFTFDGVDDNIPFSIPNVGTTISVEMWARIKSFSNGMPFGFDRYDVWANGGRLGFNTAASDIYGLTSTQVTNLGLLSQWKHYVFEMRTDVSYSNNKIYINGQNQSLSQVAGTENASLRNFNSGNGRISSWLFSDVFFIAMDLAQFRVYNRALTSQEIVQNYNATKKRYGL